MPVWLQIARSYSNPDSVNYKIAYLREQTSKNLGYLGFAEQAQLAALGKTVIVGGYLNTELIAADSILTRHLAAGAVTAEKIEVDTLSAISANIGDVTAGSLTGVTITGSTIRTAASGTRAEMGGGSTPYFDTYLGNTRRMRLESDRLNFYDENGILGGYVHAAQYSGGAVLTLRSGASNQVNISGVLGALGSDMDILPGRNLSILALNDIVSYNNGAVECGTLIANISATIDGNVSISGSLSKGSGTFLIDHPLDPDNKDLVHGFVESPKYELIYRGKVQLVDGVAEVDIDAMCDMSEGTFEALTQNAEVTSLCNLTGFTRVKPTKIIDGKFTIVAEEKVSDEISWVVMAERADYFIVNGDRWTDEKGRLIPEHNKPEYKSGDTSRKEGTIGYPRHFKKQQGSKGAD